MIGQNIEARSAITSLMVHPFVSGEPHEANPGSKKSALRNGRMLCSIKKFREPSWAC
jgi:hypothetical protein